MAPEDLAMEEMREGMAAGAIDCWLVPELICTDIEKSLRFYVDIIQFRIAYSRPEERFFYLQRNGMSLMLEQPKVRDRLWPDAELAHPYGRGVNLEMRVDDVDLIYDAAVSAGAKIHLPLEEKWYRRLRDDVCVRQFAVCDPDGYLLRPSQIIEVRPHSF
jgi:catechol 2,3-dioxygenase-like lactoylglutathione lyase family enzyme